SEKRDIWKSVVENVKSNNNFGRSLSLTCGSHPQNDLEAIEPKDFDKRPDGGCLLPLWTCVCTQMSWKL
ncbi:NFX1-type zinc finger-containing 1-like, partial [Brachionus plicatilis]